MSEDESRNTLAIKKLGKGFIILLNLFGAVSCTDNLPKETYSQFNFDPQVTETKDSLFLEYIHPIACPLQFKINTNFSDPSGIYATTNPIIVQPYDTLKLSFKKPKLADKPDTYFSYKGTELGNPREVMLDTATRYAYPFPKEKQYKIIQSYNGKFSHNSDYSRYAIDFALAIGDTVCAARDGIVVGLIKDYSVGGNDKKYRNYANFITLYHEDGTLTQYVHLKQNGVLVSLGDTVKTSQAIGLAGMTGFTSIPHLHFNTLKPTIDGVVGYPIKFYRSAGNELQRGMKVQH